MRNVELGIFKNFKGLRKVQTTKKQVVSIANQCFGSYMQCSVQKFQGGGGARLRFHKMWAGGVSL